MKLSLVVLVAMVVAMSASVAKADSVADPSIHIQLPGPPGGDPLCPPDPTDPQYPYVCVDPDTNSYLNPLIVDASSLVNGYIDVNDKFVNSGGSAGTTVLTAMHLAILIPLGPPELEYSCSSTLFLNSTISCPTVNPPNPVCPPPPAVGGSFTCNTPAGFGYLEYNLTMGDLQPGSLAIASVYEPEPSVLPLLSLGLFAVFGLGFRRKHSSANQA
jgi:hypothetical protein